MNLIVFVYMAVTALCAALIMVPFLSRWAQESGRLDQPGGRHIHKEAVPRIGGVAIFLAFLLAVVAFAEMTAALRGVLAGALIVFVTGLLDDLYGLAPRHKLIGQAGGALLAMAVGQITIGHLGDLFGLGGIDLPLWLAIPFTVFAVVGVTNAFNLFDGLDGLAGGVALIALVSFFLFAQLTKNLEVMTLCACLIGGLLGFLKYNFFPARIFMGDAGSLSVGFLLAWAAILLTQGREQHLSPVLPLLVLGLPIIDAVWVMARRLLRRRSPFAPDLGHVHHKFLDLGFEHRFTVLLIYGISLLLAVFALLCYHAPEAWLFLFFFAFFVLLYLLLRTLLRHRERFAFLQRDSARGVRDSLLFRRLAILLTPPPTLLLLLIVAYLGLLAGIVHARPGALWSLLGGAVVLGGLCTLRGRRARLVRLVLLYGWLLQISMVVQGGRAGFEPVARSLYAGSNGLLILIALVFLLRLVFQGEEALRLGGLDFLFLGLTIVLLAMPVPVTGLRGFSTAVVKALVLYFGVRGSLGYLLAKRAGSAAES